MEEIRLKGIVIKSTDYKDSDKLVTIFSADKGIIKARARGVKKAKAKLAFAVQPFAFLDFLLVEKNGFYTIINASSIDQFFDITADFDKYIFGLAALEVCDKSTYENDQNNDLFVLLIRFLSGLCYKNASAMVFFIKFMLDAFKILGFKINLLSCSCCGEKLSNRLFAFSYDYNGLLCPKCSNSNEHLELTAGENAILTNIELTDIEKIENLKFLSRESLVSVINLLCRIFRVTTGEEIESIKKFL